MLGELGLAAVLLAAVVVVAALILPRRRVKASKASLRIAFVHPDLGIGGAERLVVDAAVALQRAGHEVRLYTARHEASHCFEETRDGTLSVTVYGDFLPKMVLGRLYAACAYLRMCWISLQVVRLSLKEGFDVIIVDQVSICLPILRLARPSGIIFYCHYPDYLLTQRASLLKRIYRAPLDALEELTTGLADVVFVNSEFTAGVFAEAFPTLHRRGIAPAVLYPPLNLQDQDLLAEGAESTPPACVRAGEFLLLSINRFERKKNIDLAVRALAALPEGLRQRSRLILAGGYDERLPENVDHARELEARAEELGVRDRVEQMRSISAATKATLLRHAACLLYTPDREHFGIVPVEAMYARLPVVAVKSGGPLESISEGETGFLRPPEPAAWAQAVARLLEDGDLRLKMGEAGRARVTERFSLEAFGRQLDGAVRRLAEAPSSR